jgi:hypothetical protein
MFDEEKIPEVRKCERHLPRSLAFAFVPVRIMLVHVGDPIRISLSFRRFLLLGHVVPKAIASKKARPPSNVFAKDEASPSLAWNIRSSLSTDDGLAIQQA